MPILSVLCSLDTFLVKTALDRWKIENPTPDHLTNGSGCGILSTVGEVYAEGPPVPIPNTEVKLCRAENTWLETVRENRYSPTQTEMGAILISAFSILICLCHTKRQESVFADRLLPFWVIR